MGSADFPPSFLYSSGQGLSRAAYAKLYSAGFPPILDRHHESADVADPADHMTFVASKEEADHLQTNEIVMQFLAFSRYGIIPLTRVSHKMP